MTRITTMDYDVADSLQNNRDELAESKNYAMASAILSLRKTRQLAYIERDLEMNVPKTDRGQNLENSEF